MIDHLSLTCPIIRKAVPSDVSGIVDVLIDDNPFLVDSIFYGGIENTRNVLQNHYIDHLSGVYVLTEAELVIGVMKIHLPGVKMDKTISLPKLVRTLGIRKGIRALLLGSNWDEYKLSSGEAYIEILTRIKQVNR